MSIGDVIAFVVSLGQTGRPSKKAKSQKDLRKKVRRAQRGGPPSLKEVRSRMVRAGEKEIKKKRGSNDIREWVRHAQGQEACRRMAKYLDKTCPAFKWKRRSGGCVWHWCRCQIDRECCRCIWRNSSRCEWAEWPALRSWAKAARQAAASEWWEQLRICPELLGGDDLPVQPDDDLLRCHTKAQAPKHKDPDVILNQVEQVQEAIHGTDKGESDADQVQ